MKTFLQFLILVCTLTIIVGCSSAPKHEIIYTSSWQNDWKIAKLKECHEQSILITLTTYEVRQQAGEVMTEEAVVELQGWLAGKCSQYYKLDI